MTIRNNFARTLIAASLLAAAGAANAISIGASVDVATQAVADTTLTGAVKSKIAADARLNGSDISVTTNNDVVVLTGKATSAEAKAAAEDLAKSAKAGIRVENRIEAPGLLSTVKTDVKVAADTTGEVIDDSWISTKLKTKLLADTMTKGTAIRVTTKDNVVYLRGTVGSKAEKAQAIRLASETKGVARVNASKLKVSAKVKANADVNAQ